MRVRIVVRGPDGRRVEHLADVGGEKDLHQPIHAALDLYRQFYPDAPAFRQTISIDHA